MKNKAANRRTSWCAILLASGIAGTLDLCFAFFLSLSRGAAPEVIPKYIASGLLGEGASAGGAPVILLGISLHYAMIAVMAYTFARVAASIGLLRERRLVAGAAYGILIYLIMNFIVLPLSLVPERASGPPIYLRLADLAAHIAFVGVPIALIATRYGRPRR